MLNHHIREADGVIVLEPYLPLSAEDFTGLTEFVDMCLADHPNLHGIVIHAREFPGWDSFAAFVAHIRFVRNHHHNVRGVALATDSPVGNVVPALTRHFLAATVKQFAYDDLEAAVAWLKTMSDLPFIVVKDEVH